MQTLAKTAADQVEEQHAKDEALLPKPLPEPDKLKAQELEQLLVQVAVVDQSTLILIIAQCTRIMTSACPNDAGGATRGARTSCCHVK